MRINDDKSHVAHINEFYRLLGVSIEADWPVARKAYLRFVIVAHPDKQCRTDDPVLPPAAPCNAAVTDAKGNTLFVTSPTPGTFKYFNQSITVTEHHISNYINRWSASEVLRRLNTLKKEVRTLAHRPLAFVNVPSSVVLNGGAVTAHFINKRTRQPGSEVFELVPQGLYPVLLRGNYADVYFFERASHNGNAAELRRTHRPESHGRKPCPMHERRSRSI